MFENIGKIFKKIFKAENKKESTSGKEAKERLHLVLMQDRANVSADFLEMMKQEIIEVIKKYIDVDENAIDVRLSNQVNSDGTNGAPALYANIPIISIKEDNNKNIEDENLSEENIEEKSTENQETENEVLDTNNENKEEDNEENNKEVKNEEIELIKEEKLEEDIIEVKDKEEIESENIESENENINNVENDSKEKIVEV